jgi:hypothetical protein
MLLQFTTSEKIEITGLQKGAHIFATEAIDALRSSISTPREPIKRILGITFSTLEEAAHYVRVKDAKMLNNVMQ